MVIDPGTAMLIATAVASAAKSGGDFFANKKTEKSGKLRSKEMRRETEADMLNNAFQRSAELEAQRLSSRNKLGKRKSQSMQDTADLLRSSFNI